MKQILNSVLIGYENSIRPRLDLCLNSASFNNCLIFQISSFRPHNFVEDRKNNMLQVCNKELLIRFMLKM